MRRPDSQKDYQSLTGSKWQRPKLLAESSLEMSNAVRCPSTARLRTGNWTHHWI